MLAKKITYTDYNGVERTETFYFNLSKTELTKLQMTYPGGFAEHVEEVIDARNTEKIMALFDEMIDLAYGEKSEDGRRLIKSKELSEAFKQTEAYDKLFMELVSKDEAASNFVNGIMPADLVSNPEVMEKQKLMAKTHGLIEEKKNENAAE